MNANVINAEIVYPVNNLVFHRYMKSVLQIGANV